MGAAELAVARALSASTEKLLTSASAFGLATASNLQRAICRLSDGVPLAELWEDAAVRRALRTSAPPDVRPAEISVISGVRVAKSLIAGALAVAWSQRCDVSICGPGEVPRIPIVSLTKDNAAVVFGHIFGRVSASPYLRALLIDVREEREALTGEGFAVENFAKSIFLRHPTGVPIEIRVVAGARAGGSLVSRWLAGIIFDEYARMSAGAAEGVINYADSRGAVAERMLPGAQMFNISSPWGPEGPCYDDVQQLWGKPQPDKIVVRAPAYDMAPVLWPEERQAKAKARAERDPSYAIIYRTDVLAEFLTPEESLFSDVELRAVTRAEPAELPPMPRHDYVAAIDPATRRNAWTFVIMTREGRRLRVALAKQWMATSEPLRPRQVLAEMAQVCRAYGITTIETDQYHADSLRDLADEVGLMLNPTTYTEVDHARRALKVQTRVLEGEVELPPNDQFLADLVNVKRRTTNTGLAITLVKTRDGRHADYWPAFLRAMARYLDDVSPPPFEEGSAESLRAEEERMLAESAKRFKRGKR